MTKHFPTLKNNTELNITVNNLQIEQKSVDKLLGIKIDEQLNFGEHIHDTCKKLNEICH